MADSKSEIVVYSRSDQGGLVARGEPVTARNAPAIVRPPAARPSSPGRSSSRARSPTPTPARTTCTPSGVPRLGRGAQVWSCCGSPPATSAQYLQALDSSVPTKKLHLAALRQFFDRLVNRHVCRHQPGRDRQGRALRRRRRQDAADRPRTGPDAPQVDRRLEPGGPPGPGHPRGARLHRRPRRRRREARLSRASSTTGHSILSDSPRRAASRARSPCGTTLRGILLEYIEAAKISEGPPLPHGVPQDEDAHQERDDRHRHLPDDEAAAQGRGPAGPLLAALVPR